MGKRDSAPTIGWVLTSQLNKWLAIVFWIILFLVATFAFGVVREIDRTCKPFGRDWSINGYSVSLVVSDSEAVCVESTLSPPLLPAPTQKSNESPLFDNFSII